MKAPGTFAAFVLTAIGCAFLSSLPSNNTTSFAAVRPIAVGTQPPIALVRKLCLPAPTDMTLGVWNFYAGYLYCEVSDANTGGDLVFHQNKDGSFSIVIKGGGHVDVSLMEHFGISPRIATRLYAGLHK